MKGAGQAVGSILSGLGDFGLKLRSAITGKLDPRAEAELLQQAAQVELAAMQAQTKINEIEAASPKFFIAGARPAAIWVCVLVLFNNYILAPYLRAFGVLVPELDMGAMYPIITGLLGLGTMRSYEKIKGAAGNH